MNQNELNIHGNTVNYYDNSFTYCDEKITSTVFITIVLVGGVSNIQSDNPF